MATKNLGGLTLPNGATSGYVLTSDSSGNGTWQAASGGGGGTTVNINSTQIDQTPAGSTYGTLGGTVNGSNAVFTTSLSKYVSGTLEVSLNGQPQTQGSGHDWVETTPASGTFTFNTAPPTGSIIQVSYVTSSSTGRLAKRVLALSANSATPTIDTDNYDVVHITSQSTAITSFTTNLTGTPVDGDTIRFSITGTTSIALTWGSLFESSTVTLPTTTASTARLDVGFLWNTETSKWRCTAVA